MASSVEQSHSVGNLLTYLPSYRVVICKVCQFAIQPTALSSHLQKHKVFRSQRRTLLNELSRFDLVPPSEVGSPPCDTPVIPDLTCYDGYRCESPDCDYACTSEKRMSQHWSQIHHCSSHKDVQARVAKLQTFFRGTQIHYFEVASATNSPGQTRFYARRQHSISTPDSGVDGVSPIDFHEFPTLPDPDPESHVIAQFTGLDVKAMMYMHRFTVSSAPDLSLGMGHPTFWTQELPRQAARYPFLMYTILGVGACHESLLTTNVKEAQEHQRVSRQYYSLALPSYRYNIVKPTVENGTALAVTARCLGVQDLVLSSLESQHAKDMGYHMSQSEAMSFLTQFLVLMRGSFDMLLDLQEYVADDSSLKLDEDDLVYMHNAAHNDGLGDDRVTPSLYVRQTKPRPLCVPSDRYERMLLLPSRLATQGVTVEDDVLMITRCTGTLLDAFEDSWTVCHESQWLVWRAIQCWPLTSAVKEHFMPALRGGRPAAIIVLAHWLVDCVRMTEATHWFAAGQTEKMMDLCKIALDHNPQYTQLIDELMS